MLREPALACALGLAAALALVPSTAEAGGDNVYGTRGGEALAERGHEIELSFDRGYAKLRVRRTVHNGIARHDEAQLWLNLPAGAVATDLRTLGEQDGKPKWFAADLLEAEAAAARYQELTGLGGYYPKDPALLSWRSQEQLALQVFPVAPGTDKTIEYTLEIPATWEDGRWHLYLPSLGTDAMPAEVVLEPAEGLDQLFIDGEVVARGHHLTLDRDVELALAPRDPKPYALELASIETGARHLAHVRLTLAPEISTVPRDANIVLILDLSRSRDGELGGQIRAALTYLEHFEDPELAAEVALLGFDREVHALSSGFVSASEAITILERAAPTLRNGSDLGLALAKADELLAAASKRAPRRIVVLSDFETASRIQPEQLQVTAEHSRAIVHLVDISADYEASLERDDSHAWAPLAAATEGVYWTAGAPDSWADPDMHAAGLAVFEELARPVRIDDFAIRVDGLTLADDPDYFSSFEPTLAEGQGIDDLLLSNTPATKLIVEGRTWNKPLRETQKPSRAHGDRWSALVFGSDILYELTEPEMMKLAMRGGAVSPVTSYLAIEPGVRPSTEGIEEGERDWGVGSAMGVGGLSLRGVGGGGGGGVAFDKRAWLEGELRTGWAQCGGDGTSATISLETQTAEILDIALAASDASTGLHACMQQIAWSVELVGDFQSFETWSFDLG